MFWPFNLIWHLPKPAPHEEVYITPEGPAWKMDMGQGLSLTINPDGSQTIVAEPQEKE